MTKVEKVAGIDISKNTLDVCLITPQGEKHTVFTNDTKGFCMLCAWIDPDTFCVMEVTGPYYLRLALYLDQNGFKLSVVNPLVIRRFSQMRLQRAKTDKADAKMIALYGFSELPPRWQAPQQVSIELQQLDATYEQLVKQKTALNNQLQAFSHTGVMSKELKQFLQNAIRSLQTRLQWVEKQTDKLIALNYQALVTNLMTIPGIGKKTAVLLIMLTGGFEKFASPKQLCAYLGLAPRIFQSGSSVRGRARICKMGRGRLRALLYLCAWSAARYNKTCHQLYQRLLNKGKAKNLALIAVANKLLKQAFAIATQNSTYQPDYQKNICF